MKELLLELSNYQNAILMFVTWAIIEGMTPLVRFVVMHPRLVRFRLTLYNLQKYGKRTAGMIWCSGLVWVPYAQPPLCEPLAVDAVDGLAPAGCQTPFARVALGLILGVLLSSGHWAGAKAFRKLLGRKKKVWVICVNCSEKVAVESLGEACPKCNEPPHEVTNHTRTE